MQTGNDRSDLITTIRKSRKQEREQEDKHESNERNKARGSRTRKRVESRKEKKRRSEVGKGVNDQRRDGQKTRSSKNAITHGRKTMTT